MRIELIIHEDTDVDELGIDCQRHLVIVTIVKGAVRVQEGTYIKIFFDLTGESQPGLSPCVLLVDVWICLKIRLP
jgi:hypothetical protein